MIGKAKCLYGSITLYVDISHRGILGVPTLMLQCAHNTTGPTSLSLYYTEDTVSMLPLMVLLITLSTLGNLPIPIPSISNGLSL